MGPFPPQTRREVILKTKDDYYLAISIPKDNSKDNRSLEDIFCQLTKDDAIRKCGELDGEAVELVELYESSKNSIFKNALFMFPSHIRTRVKNL